MPRGNTPNTPEAILSEHLDFLLHAYRIYEEAVSEATFEEFVSKGEEIEPYHHASCVRFRARTRLSKNKPRGLEYEMRPLSNNGIHAVHRERSIKIYKGVDGCAPSCGTSQAKRDFYQQELLPDDLPTKLVLIYNVTKDGTLLGLDLINPKGVVKDFEAPEAYWSIALPHPATMQSGAQPYAPKPDTLDKHIRRDNADEDDLDITLDGTGNE
jgi:hypothetical protein